MKIEDIQNPSFLKELDPKELNELAKEIRSFIIQNVSETGGHLSSNLGTVELIIALHKIFNGLDDKILFDVGHQAYTHKILTGRAKQFKTLRKINGLSGFLKMKESPYDIFESGHSSTSISAAMGMAAVRNNAKDKYSIIAVIGDASIANGVAFEALNNIKSSDRVIIILNDNDMSISSSVGALAKSLSKIRTSRTYSVMKRGYVKFFQAIPIIGTKFIHFTRRIMNRITLLFRSSNLFDQFELSYLGPVDGHNIKALLKALKKAKNYHGSMLIHVKTKKGFGYHLAENDENGKWHGTLPFDIESGKCLHQKDDLSYSQLYGQRLEVFMKENPDLYLISAAMKTGSYLNECFSQFPERCFDVGIAEEHAVCFANGIALNKKIPIVSLYSTFLQRSYDEILHDVIRVNSHVIFLIDRAGLVGSDGETHHGVFDVSFLYPSPNLIIFMAPNSYYIDMILEYAIHYNGPVFIRYPKDRVKESPQLKKELDLHRFLPIKEYDQFDASLIVVGDAHAQFVDYFKNSSWKINVYSPFMLKPIDEVTLEKIAQKPVYVYDPFSIFAGFSSEILKYLTKFKTKFQAYTLPNTFVQHGNKDDLYKQLHLTIADVAKQILEDMENHI